MSTFKNFLFHFKYISFIFFLYAGVILYPSLVSMNIGICCLVLLVIYSITTFIMFFVKSSEEQYNVLNNFVLCFLHIYFCFIAYKYYSIGDAFGIANTTYFNLNYFVAALCLFVLTINKFILSNIK